MIFKRIFKGIALNLLLLSSNNKDLSGNVEITDLSDVDPYSDDKTDTVSSCLLRNAEFSEALVERSMNDFDRHYRSQVFAKVQEFYPQGFESGNLVAEVTKNISSSLFGDFPQDSIATMNALVTKDVEFELEKAKKINKMLDKCKYIDGDNWYGLHNSRFSESFFKVCFDEEHFKDLEEVFNHPDFYKLYVYDNERDFMLDHSQLTESEKVGGMTSVHHRFDSQKNFIHHLVIGINLDKLHQFSKESGRSLDEEVEITIKHEKEHAKHYLRNGIMNLKLGAAFHAHPFFPNSEPDQRLKVEIEDCVKCLKEDPSINHDDLNLALKRLRTESSAEGLAELIGTIEIPKLKELCESLYTFSFGETKVRSCKVENGSASPLKSEEKDQER